MTDLLHPVALKVTGHVYLMPHELRRLTSSDDPAQQRNWLSANGVRFEVGRLGIPLVRRSHYRDACFEQESRIELPVAIHADLQDITTVFQGKYVGMVYAIDEGHDESPVKIGWSEVNAASRLTSLQTGNPRVLRLLCHHPAAWGAEQLIHRMLGAHRLAGEWFERTPTVRQFLVVAINVDFCAALETIVGAHDRRAA